MNLTEKFDVQLLPIQHCQSYNRAEYKLAVIQFDIVQDGKPFDDGFNGRYGCCRKGLEEIVEVSNDFLAGKFTKDECLWFDVPYIVGNFIGYQYFFDIHVGEKPEDNYWEFKVAEGFITAEKRGIKYTCILNRDQVAALGRSVAEQIDVFDWDNCGKTEFFRFSVPEKPYEWCYSAKQLERTLNDIIPGDRLKAIYVYGEDYFNPLREEDGYWNCYGPRVCLEFGETYADIMAHAEGLFEIRLFDSSEVIKERYYEEMKKPDEELCNIGYVFHLTSEGETIKQINVEATGFWAFDIEGFDKSKVSNPVELPESIVLILENKNKLTITGNQDDFSIKMEPAEE